MSLNVPSEITERITDATTEVVDHEIFVHICKESLPGAVKMYQFLRRELDVPVNVVYCVQELESREYHKKCFHGFTDVERGHVIRACYGDAINRELNEHFDLVLVRVAAGRVVGFASMTADSPDFRRRVFDLSAQKAHEDDRVETPAIVDHPDTLREIERLYPLAYARLAAHGGRPFADFETKEPALFAQMIEMLSIRPYRFLLEDAFGELATVNCCGSAGKGKERPPVPEQGKGENEKEDESDEQLFAFRQTRTFQLQMQEPYLLDC